MNSDANPTTPAATTDGAGDPAPAHLALPNPRDWSVTAPTEGPHYPQKDIYQFGEFAGVVVEMGGYSDLSLVDPYTGRRLWLSQALGRWGHREGEEATVVNIYDGIRALIDLAEAVGFMGTTARTHPDHAKPDEMVG